jgi:hypothetical protein
MLHSLNPHMQTLLDMPTEVLASICACCDVPSKMVRPGVCCITSGHNTAFHRTRLGLAASSPDQCCGRRSALRSRASACATFWHILVMTVRCGERSPCASNLWRRLWCTPCRSSRGWCGVRQVRCRMVVHFCAVPTSVGYVFSHDTTAYPQGSHDFDWVVLQAFEQLFCGPRLVVLPRSTAHCTWHCLPRRARSRAHTWRLRCDLAGTGSVRTTTRFCHFYRSFGRRRPPTYGRVSLHLLQRSSGWR